ncbi:MAG TPA: hypothetical protein VH008_32855 [Pseudonocardia sp.]|jgi:hypothetical protein|nr:hypothetical protein [Pseudonocardia sp.]
MSDIKVAPTDAAALMEHFLAGMIFTPYEDLDTALQAFINPAYTQVTDGVKADRSEFVAHMAHVRGAIASGHVVVHEALREGRRIADRHTIHIAMHDGRASSFEVLLIGSLDERDRLLEVFETTRQLTGDADHADLGSAR